MPRGKVKWFSPEKGYGFIQGDNKHNDVFVHFSEIEGDGFRLLHDGEQVEYELYDSARGYQARKVRRLAGKREGEDQNPRDP